MSCSCRDVDLRGPRSATTSVPKIPACYPDYASRCDMRLPEAALAFRQQQVPALTNPTDLGRMNITAWLYLDERRHESVAVNPNVTIAELRRQFGPAETADAEVGIHSEMQSAEWFRVRPRFQVLQIFTERIPCKVCHGMLRHYYPRVP